MTNLSIPNPQNLSNLERREIARAELARMGGIDIYGYFLITEHVRRGVQSDGYLGHALIDVYYILSDSEDEPRFLWRDAKARLKKIKPQLCEKITQLKLPSWADGKRYKTDVMDKGWLFNFIYALNTQLALQFQEAFAEDLKRYPIEYRTAILNELDKPTGWAGIRNHLIMAAHHDPEDFENPNEPPGSLKDRPTLWRPKR